MLWSLDPQVAQRPALEPDGWGRTCAARLRAARPCISRSGARAAADGIATAMRRNQRREPRMRGPP